MYVSDRGAEPAGGVQLGAAADLPGRDHRAETHGQCPGDRAAGPAEHGEPRGCWGPSLAAHETPDFHIQAGSSGSSS